MSENIPMECSDKKFVNTYLPVQSIMETNFSTIIITEDDDFEDENEKSSEMETLGEPM